MPKLKKDVVPERAPIFVTVARLGGEVKKYCLNGERDVQAALDAAELVSDNDDRIRVNGEPATLETELKDGDVLTVAGRIEGAL